MQTKLSTIAAKLMESGWLVALIVVPILFNIYTERVFEEDKIPLMRSIAVVIFFALIVWLIERPRRTTGTAPPEGGGIGGALRRFFWVEDRPLWRVPVVMPALLVSGAYLLSTIFSIVPHISFWGAYIRRQGTYSWLSYVVIFFAILFLVRHRRQVDRIVTVALLTSLPGALYGVLQHFGRDPLPWGGDVIDRVSSTAGNPIFIAAFMIMVVPLTLVRVIEHFARLMENPVEGEPPPNYLAPSLLGGAYLFLLIVQLVTILYAQSRGPFIGLGVGLTFFFIVFALRRRIRWLTLSIAGLAIAGILFLVAFNLPNTPLEPLRDVKYIGRLGRIFEVESGTGKVRVLIWEGASDLFTSNPLRMLVGYGPEAMYVAYNPFYPPDLAHYEARNASPDRSHNETFDSLVTTGLFGFLAQTSLFLIFFASVLRWLAMINTRRQTMAFFGTAIGGGVLGALGAVLLDGSLRYLGVGIPAGIALGLITYLLTYAVTHLNSDEPPSHPYSLLLIGLLAGVIAHYVEIHFGIAIGATRLYFWAFIALATVVGALLHQQAEGRDAQPTAVIAGTTPSPAAARRERRQARSRIASPSPVAGRQLLSGSLLGLSALMGLVMVILTFNFYTPSFDLSAKGYSLVWLFVGAWLFGALTVSAESAFEQGEERRWTERVGAYALISLGIWVLFTVVYVPWVNWQPNLTQQITPEQLRDIAGHLADTVSVLYFFVLLIMIGTALVFLRDEPWPTPWTRTNGAPVVGYALLPFLAIALISSTNLNISRADIFSKQGAGYERAGQWDAAQILYTEALRLQPQEDRYFLNLGRALMEKARVLTQQAASATEEGQRSTLLQQRDAYLQQALDTLVKAQRTNPLNTDHTRNLASLHRVWATLIDDSNEKARHLNEAGEYYQRAVTLSPNNAALWNDWAALHLDLQQREEAMAKLDQSLKLDDRYVDTYLLRASAYVDEQEFSEAVEDYDRALEVSPKSMQAWSGKAYALSQMGDTAAAIEANKSALALSPNDFVSRRNLALLYQQQGDFEQAIEQAEAALEVAGPADQAALQAFIQQLRQQQATSSTGG